MWLASWALVSSSSGSATPRSAKTFPLPSVTEIDFVSVAARFAIAHSPPWLVGGVPRSARSPDAGWRSPSSISSGRHEARRRRQRTAPEGTECGTNGMWDVATLLTLLSRRQAIPLRSVVAPAAGGPVYGHGLEGERPGERAPAPAEDLPPDVREPIADPGEGTGPPAARQGGRGDLRGRGDLAEEGGQVGRPR